MGNTRIPDGGGSPRIIEATANVENKDRPSDTTPADVIDPNPPVKPGGGSSAVSSEVSTVLLSRGRDAELTKSGDVSAREAIDTLAALLGTKPSSAISARALVTLEALGTIHTVCARGATQRGPVDE